MAVDIIPLSKFEPYKLEELGVIIPQPTSYMKRLEWFWPQFKRHTPEIVLQNTIVVFQPKGHADITVEEAIRDFDGPAISCEEEHGIVYATLAGLDHLKTRLIARIADDIELSDAGWAEKVVAFFNEEPHLKLLADISITGRYGIFTSFDLTKLDWLDNLLQHGKFKGYEYAHGHYFITNRAVWESYYREVVKYTKHDCEDVVFSFLSRADGLPCIHRPRVMSLGFCHRGISNRDMLKL